jgi:hypothetical protein
MSGAKGHVTSKRRPRFFMIPKMPKMKILRRIAADGAGSRGVQAGQCPCPALAVGRRLDRVIGATAAAGPADRSSNAPSVRSGRVLSSLRYRILQRIA